MVQLTYDSADIGDFLKEEIKGPASFSCMTGGGCKFEEPAMNGLINSVFGDKYITLDCKGGECLHYSQVPGYVVSYREPSNTGICQYCLVVCRGRLSRTILSGLHSVLLEQVYSSY